MDHDFQYKVRELTSELQKHKANITELEAAIKKIETDRNSKQGDISSEEGLAKIANEDARKDHESKIHSLEDEIKTLDHEHEQKKLELRREKEKESDVLYDLKVLEDEIRKLRSSR